MWYLKTDTLLLLAGFAIVCAVLRKLSEKLCKKLPINYIFPLLELLILGLIDLGLLAFYAAYMALGLMLCRALERPHKPIMFGLFCLLAISPLFVSRSAVFGFEPRYPAIFIGVAFNMLKLTDAIFYVHYSGEHIDALTYTNYMLFLPVFTSGPIFRYRDFKKTYSSPVPLDSSELAEDVKRIIKGLFKKVVLLELIIMLQTRLLSMGQHLYVSLALTFVSYFILYMDLSGYSDIAIGFGRICGYNVPENFKKPWLAPTFTQFWRSWHSSLSDWIREHIYILLVKKKLNKAKSALIALFTMVIMALWHGFNIPYFVVCGLYLGGLLAIENLLGKTTVSKRKTKRSVYYLRCFAVNFLFAVNTLVFTLPEGEFLNVLRGFIRL